VTKNLASKYLSRESDINTKVVGQNGRQNFSYLFSSTPKALTNLTKGDSHKRMSVIHHRLKTEPIDNSSKTFKWKNIT
jgi:hypothetical protein